MTGQKSHTTDAEEENFQGEWRGLKESQTGDKFTPNLAFKSNSELLAQTTSSFFPYIAVY